MGQRNKVVSITTLLDGWSKVVRVAYRQMRRDGSWQDQDRDLLDRGDGVTVLPYNRARQTVLLLRQPRIVATMNGGATGETIEACNGLIERGESAMECALREVEEEVGHRLARLQPVTEVYASPGGSLEMVHLFIGGYDDTTRVAEGGGIAEEGEDIEALEVTLAQAMQWVEEGVIRDARTMLVLQHVVLQRTFEEDAR